MSSQRVVVVSSSHTHLTNTTRTKLFHQVLAFAFVGLSLLLATSSTTSGTTNVVIAVPQAPLTAFVTPSKQILHPFTTTTTSIKNGKLQVSCSRNAKLLVHRSAVSETKRLSPSSLHYRETPDEDTEVDDVAPPPQRLSKKKKKFHDKYGFDLPRSSSTTDDEEEDDITSSLSHNDEYESNQLNTINDDNNELNNHTDERSPIIKALAFVVMFVFTIFENVFSLCMYTWASLTMVGLALNVFGYGFTLGEHGHVTIDTLEKMRSDVQFERQIQLQEQEDLYYEQLLLQKSTPPRGRWQ